MISPLKAYPNLSSYSIMLTYKFMLCVQVKMLRNLDGKDVDKYRSVADHKLLSFDWSAVTFTLS